MIIKASVHDAIEVLKVHRSRHIEDYKEAQDTWRKDMEEYSKLLEEWVKSSSPDRPEEPSRPRNYLGEYDKLINKLGRHHSEIIDLNDSEYSTIFEDHFYWQNQFQRQKAPIYTMGSPSPNSFSRGPKGDFSGSLGSNKALVEDDLHIPIDEE